MGDRTAIGDYPNAMDNYDLVPSGLIKLINEIPAMPFPQMETMPTPAPEPTDAHTSAS